MTSGEFGGGELADDGEAGGPGDGGPAEGGAGRVGERQAVRLLRWYPAGWRARYGAEFAELLIADLADQPRNWRRTADVIASGLLARLTSVGLTGQVFDPAEQARTSLATVGCALAAFLTLGLAMLGQLAIGWQWATPRAGATMAGSLIMSIAAGLIVVLILAAALPLGWHAATSLIRRRSRPGWPAAVAVAAAAALVGGAHHFQNAWPGTGGTAAHRGLLPAGPAAFGWASTLSVSDYWAHPAALRGFPGPELAWMTLSPVVLVCLIAAVARLLRRQRASSRLLAYEGRLASGAALAMGAFFGGAACWVFGAGSAASGLFHAGALDVVGLAVMAAALATAIRAASTVRRAALALCGLTPSP